MRGSLDHRLWRRRAEQSLILSTLAVILNPLTSDCFEFRLDAPCAADRAANIYLRTRRSVTAYRAGHCASQWGLAYLSALPPLPRCRAS
jgi:hypothetical protein